MIDDITGQAPAIHNCIENASHTPKVIHKDELPYLMYSLVIFPSPELQQAIHAVSEVIEKQFSGQFYYPSNRYHMTLLGAMPAADVTEADLIRQTHSVLDSTTITGQPYGICLATAGVTIPVYFGHNVIHKIREELRSKTGLGQDYTTDNVLWEHIGWFQIMRFLSEPPADLASYLEQFKDTSFPPITNPTVELIATTSKTLAPGKWKVLESFK